MSSKIGSPWTESDDKLLIELTDAGATLEDCARVMCRTIWGCRSRRRKLTDRGVLGPPKFSTKRGAVFVYKKPSPETAALLEHHKRSDAWEYLGDLNNKILSGEMPLLQLAFSETLDQGQGFEEVSADELKDPSVSYLESDSALESSPMITAFFDFTLDDDL